MSGVASSQVCIPPPGPVVTLLVKAAKVFLCSGSIYVLRFATT